MEIKEIQILIDRYWDGLTNIEDEKTISSFFVANNDLTPELEVWRDWFVEKKAMNEVKLDDAFDDKILAYARESLAPKKKDIRLKLLVWASVASVAIGCFAYFSWIQTSEPAFVVQNEISAEEQKEYEIVKELLCFTASKINETEVVLGENLSKIDVINTYINIK